MDREKAIALMNLMKTDDNKCEAWQSGGNIWLVTFVNNAGNLVCISDEVICEYKGNGYDMGNKDIVELEAFYDGDYLNSVSLY